MSYSSNSLTDGVAFACLHNPLDKR